MLSFPPARHLVVDLVVKSHRIAPRPRPRPPTQTKDTRTQANTPRYGGIERFTVGQSSSTITGRIHILARTYITTVECMFSLSARLTVSAIHSSSHEHQTAIDRWGLLDNVINGLVRHKRIEHKHLP